MQSRIFMSSRRLSLLLGLLLVVGLAGGCSSDSDSDSGDKGSSSTGNKGISLTYNGDTIKAGTSVSAVNSMFIGKDFTTTIISGWASTDGDAKFGTITTRIKLEGDADDTLTPGRYELEEDTSGMGNLSGPMKAALVIEKGTLGLPSSVEATSGSFTISSAEMDGSKLAQISIDFDGTFKNKSDDTDTAEYQVKGSIELPKK